MFGTALLLDLVDMRRRMMSLAFRIVLVWGTLSAVGFGARVGSATGWMGALSRAGDSAGVTTLGSWSAGFGVGRATLVSF